MNTFNALLFVHISHRQGLNKCDSYDHINNACRLIKKKKKMLVGIFFLGAKMLVGILVCIYIIIGFKSGPIYIRKKKVTFFFLRRKKGLIYSTTSSTLSGTIFSTFSSFHLLAWHFFLAILLLPLILIHIVLWKNFPLNGGKIKFNW